MDEVESGTGAAAPSPPRAGAVLLAARTNAGLTLDEVSARTRVPLRHLSAIETGDYAELPSPTYAVGFAKAYARAVGADEVAVAAEVRQEVAKIGRRQPEYTPYEIADPARVPSRGVAIVGLGIAIAVLVLVGLWYGSSLFRGNGAGNTAAPGTTAAAPVAAVRPVPMPTPVTGGQVTLTATDEVWLRVYDAANKTLFQGTMKAGDKFDVPSGADDPKINVGRPDKLSVTLNGSAIPPLGDGSRPIKDVRVSASALAARLAGAAPAAAGEASAPPPTQVQTSQTTVHRAERTPHASRRHLTEVQRANLQSAAHLPPAAR